MWPRARPRNPNTRRSRPRSCRSAGAARRTPDTPSLRFPLHDLVDEVDLFRMLRQRIFLKSDEVVGLCELDSYGLWGRPARPVSAGGRRPLGAELRDGLAEPCVE